MNIHEGKGLNNIFSEEPNFRNASSVLMVTEINDKVCIKSSINTIFARKIVNILLPISLSLCFGCSKEPSHLDGSFDYP